MNTRRRTISILVFGLLVASCAGCREEPELRPVPPCLVGCWENGSRSHADRQMTIAARSIRFGQGGSLSETHSILGVVENVVGGGMTEFNLTCVDAGGEPYNLLLLYDGRRNAETLRIRSQASIVWRKRASS